MKLDELNKGGRKTKPDLRQLAFGRFGVVLPTMIGAIALAVAAHPLRIAAGADDAQRNAIAPPPAGSEQACVEFGTAWLKKIESGDFSAAYDDLTPELRNLLEKDEFIARGNEERARSYLSRPGTSCQVVGSNWREIRGGRGNPAFGILLVNMVIPLPDAKGGKKVTLREPATVMVQRLPNFKWNIGIYMNLPGADILNLKILIFLHKAQIEQQNKAVRKNVEK